MSYEHSTTPDPAIRRAVLAGVGEARNEPAAALTDAVSLMAEATSDLLEGPTGNLRDRIGLVCATVGSDDSPDPAGAAAEALGMSGVTTMVAAIGVPQQRLVSEAILAVQNGDADAVLLLGGEAKGSASRARREGLEAPSVPQGPGAERHLVPHGEFITEAEVAAMMWDPVTQYALIDSALARADGLSPVQLRSEVSELWARFDEVANHNPHAQFAGPPHSAASLSETTAENRLLAFPYNKWHSTQWAMDHATALLICAEDLAVAAGIPTGSMLHPHVALHSSWGLSLSRRAQLHRWPMMELMGQLAAEHSGTPVDQTDLIELYSCFPAAVRVQQRALGLPRGGTPTVTGGMAFAGGPFNHFTYLATAELFGLLTTGEADSATVTTVSGMLTKGGLMEWGSEPLARGPLVADVAARAEANTASVEVAPWNPDRAAGPFGGSGPDSGSTDRVLAATITGGFEPTLFALTEEPSGLRHVVATPAPDGDPADLLAALS